MHGTDHRNLHTDGIWRIFVRASASQHLQFRSNRDRLGNATAENPFHDIFSVRHDGYRQRGDARLGAFADVRHFESRRRVHIAHRMDLHIFPDKQDNGMPDDDISAFMGGDNACKRHRPVVVHEEINQWESLDF